MPSAQLPSLASGSHFFSLKILCLVVSDNARPFFAYSYYDIVFTERQTCSWARDLGKILGQLEFTARLS